MPESKVPKKKEKKSLYDDSTLQMEAEEHRKAVIQSIHIYLYMYIFNHNRLSFSLLFVDRRVVGTGHCSV